MKVYTIICTKRKTRSEDLIMIYSSEELANKHIEKYQQMYLDIGCTLRVEEYPVETVLK